MALLGGSIETPRELYLHKLGAALKMENTILGMLEDLQEHANETTFEGGAAPPPRRAPAARAT